MKTRLQIIVIAAIFLLSTTAHALSVMGFETPPFQFGLNLNECMHGTYTENGIRLQNTAGHYDLLQGGSPGGTRYVNVDIGSPASDFSNGPISTVRFDQFGELFNLLSIDVIGDLFQGNGSLTSSAGGLLAFPTNGGTYTFSGAPWTNLAWVDFSSFGNVIGIDNFTVQAIIPEPAALWLLIAGCVVSVMGSSYLTKVIPAAKKISLT